MQTLNFSCRRVRRAAAAEAAEEEATIQGFRASDLLRTWAGFGLRVHGLRVVSVGNR